MDDSLSALSTTKLSFNYGSRKTVDRVNLRLRSGTLTALVGPNGAGKSTLLHLLEGRLKPSQGTVNTSKSIGLMPQRAAIDWSFPITARDMVQLGVPKQGNTTAEIHCDQVLERVGMGAMGGRRLSQLSGGQQQRVALARAMAPNPNILLLDEPFASLDMGNTNRLIREMRKLLKQNDVTTLMVTHDQNEAFIMSDEVILVNSGRIQEKGNPITLFQSPTTIFAAEFLGLGSVVSADLDSDGNLGLGLGKIPAHLETDRFGERVKLLLRPNSVISDNEGSHTLKILEKNFHGRTQSYVLELPDKQNVVCDTSPDVDKAVGQSLTVRFCLDEVTIF